MSGLSQQDAAQLRAHLQHAATSCTDRCLYHSAKWAAELLNSFETPDDGEASDTDPDSPMSEEASAQSAPSNSIKNDPVEERLERKEAAKFLLARSYFDCREFDRCCAVFLPGTLPKGTLAPQSPRSLRPKTTPSKGKGKAPAASAAAAAGTPGKPREADDVSRLSQKALFLALYAKYISGEKRKHEDNEMILGPADGGVTVNRELPGITKALEDWFAEAGRAREPRTGQGWLEYLYGIVLAKGKNEDMAKKWLIRSVHLYPYNWGAWQELSTLINTVEELQMITEQLPRNLMAFIFHIYTSQELYQSTEQIHAHLSQLQAVFPQSAFLQTQRALLLYHSKDFEESETIFAGILRTDPHRLDALDYYSNILYVMEMRPKLAFLAQLASATDKFRPETCCVVGNYYSLRSEHEKAVVYFRRALALDRDFLSAWTLMGHEYVEMKNTHAAIESYRRAVDVNRRDYRAWYGLGQTYEVLEMHSYALFYYQRAAALRPFDAKMWMAVGQCFGRIGKFANCIRAYKRALVAGSYYDGAASAAGGGGGGGGAGSAAASFGTEAALADPAAPLDPDVLVQIALTHERLDEYAECAAYMELALAQEEGVPPASSLGDSSDPAADLDRSSSSLFGASGAGGGGGASAGGGGGGTGVTPATSRARAWLARWAYARGEFQRCVELANEMVQDGVEAEEAKALMRDVRARVDAGQAEGQRGGVEEMERRMGRRM